jgi:hypothetical protein
VVSLSTIFELRVGEGDGCGEGVRRSSCNRGWQLLASYLCFKVWGEVEVGKAEGRLMTSVQCSADGKATSLKPGLGVVEVILVQTRSYYEVAASICAPRENITQSRLWHPVPFPSGLSEADNCPIFHYAPVLS